METIIYFIISKRKNYDFITNQINKPYLLFQTSSNTKKLNIYEKNKTKNKKKF